MWAVKTADPKALRGRVIYRLQDAAKLPMIDSILRMNLINVLEYQLDKEGIQGDSTANAQTFTSNGFFNFIPAAQTTELADNVATPGTMTNAQIKTFYQALLGAGVDGRYAETQSDVSLFLTPALYRATLGLALTRFEGDGLSAVHQERRVDHGLGVYPGDRPGIGSESGHLDAGAGG